MAFGWSSIEPYNTHNEITSFALFVMPKDNARRVKPLPNVNRILNFDYVKIDNYKLTGTGPDVGTNSKYSEHYYNPYLDMGGAPDAVAKNFHILLTADPNSDKAAKAAAYAAHFLADMHVPFHVFGMPSKWAFDGYRQGKNRIKPEITGPLFLYGGSPPYNFGRDNNFMGAIQNFVRLNTKGSDVDWFDAWYWNGVGKDAIVPQEPLTATSSHGWWEFSFQSEIADEQLKKAWDQIRKNSKFDPGWVNELVPAGADYRKFAKGRIKQFTKDCAMETSKGVKTYHRDKYYSMVRAIRAVMTMFRASQTTIHLQKRDKGDHLKYVVTNLNPEESLLDPTVRVYTNGKLAAEKKYDDIAAKASLVIDSKVEGDKKIVVEVSGMYMDTPDLCYNRIEFTSTEPQDQELSEHTCPIPQGAKEKWSTWVDGISPEHYYVVPDGRVKGATKKAGPHKIYYSKGGQLHVDACYDENGKENGWRTVYDRKGNIRGQVQYQHGALIYVRYEKGKRVDRRVK